MAQHVASGVLFISLLGMAIAAQVLEDHTEPQAQTEGVKTLLYDDAVDDQRIVGGRPTTAEKFPWQLLVLTQEINRTGNCGGSIISQTWSMSAAHCFTAAKPDGKEGFIVTALRISLYAGVTSRYNLTSADGVQSNIFNEDDFENHVFIHPEYKIGARFNNDIAIFKLKQPWTLNEKVSPIALADADDFIVGKRLTASGWGKTCAACGNSNILLYVAHLNLISREECTAYWGASKVTDNMICHKTRRRNTCGGDSGGPVITGRGNSNRPPYVQIGIVSWGSFRSTCQNYYAPKVFVDVAKYRTWIDETISAQPTPPAPSMLPTSPPTTIPSASSKPDACKDESINCAKLAARGKCNNTLIFVKCKSTCACGVNSNPPCYDTNSRCPKLAAQGKCSNTTVYKKCRASCACGKTEE